MTHTLVTQIVGHGYLAIFVLMVLESACIPIPSEVIMLLGGALAGGLVVSGVQLHLNVLLVALAGTGGNLVGAVIAYEVGRRGGRIAVQRWGRYVLLRERDLDRAERFFARWGSGAVFFGRMLPVVRTFISLPAGVAEMPRVRFGLFTALGSIPWTLALALAGDAAASHWKAVSSVFTPISIVIAVIAVGLIIRWGVRRKRAADVRRATVR